MDLTIETISPKQAEKYLQFNSNNRPLRKSLVNQYAKDMASGRWKLTHQGVAFNCDGTLLDGQHRLAAIVESKASVQMLVARGVQSSSQLVMDDHARRSAADALSLTRKEKITSKQIAIIRACIEGNRRGVSRETKQQLADIVGVFRPAIEFVEGKMPTNQKGVTSAPIKAAIVLAWYYVQDIDRLGAFCDVLTGRNLPGGNSDRAAFLLREWCFRNGMSGSTTVRDEAMRKAQRAIAAFVAGEEITKLYGTTVYYPWPLVDPVRGRENG